MRTTPWQAKLQLDYTKHGSRTWLSHEHEGPLRVQRPFFPEGAVNHTYLLHPPGGLVGDDQLEVALHIGADAHALITTPGATKAYRNITRASQIHQQFDVAGTLEWLPQEVILFDGSRLTSDTTISLRAGARLLAWEIQCFGRPAGDLPFHTGEVTFRLQVQNETRLLMYDNLMVRGGADIMQAAWGLHDHTAVGVMLAYPADKALCDLATRSLLAADVAGAATLLDDLLVVRIMDAHAQGVRRGFVEVWQQLRPALLGRPACLPRIWST